MPAAMGADYALRAPGVDAAIGVDQVVIADGVEAAGAMPCIDVRYSHVPPVGGGCAVDDDFVDISHNTAKVRR